MAASVSLSLCVRSARSKRGLGRWKEEQTPHTSTRHWTSVEMLINSTTINTPPVPAPFALSAPTRPQSARGFFVLFGAALDQRANLLTGSPLTAGKGAHDAGAHDAARKHRRRRQPCGQEKESRQTRRRRLAFRKRDGVPRCEALVSMCRVQHRHRPTTTIGGWTQESGAVPNSSHETVPEPRLPSCFEKRAQDQRRGPVQFELQRQATARHRVALSPSPSPTPSLAQRERSVLIHQKDANAWCRKRVILSPNDVMYIGPGSSALKPRPCSSPAGPSCGSPPSSSP